ncbi:hypothetical protein C7N43_20520 [Sphingobacteriales bacterium UPWRP_1]|nr:hypothetical protein BVG80_02090 [Sphingobacteriales bacterium TSM_CSM]PSJ75151.1 hypothetical protein C7N43_20520 [Sphingobacteriales bacterium UPWRP_1]
MPATILIRNRKISVQCVAAGQTKYAHLTSYETKFRLQDTKNYFTFYLRCLQKSKQPNRKLNYNSLM